MNRDTFTSSGRTLGNALEVLPMSLKGVWPEAPILEHRTITLPVAYHGVGPTRATPAASAVGLHILTLRLRSAVDDEGVPSNVVSQVGLRGYRFVKPLLSDVTPWSRHIGIYIHIYNA